MRQPLQFIKNIGRTARKIVFGDMCGENEDIFAQANPICRRENIYLAQFAAGIAAQFKQIAVGVVVAGELAPPSASLSKIHF